MLKLQRKETLEALSPLRGALASRTAGMQELSYLWFDGKHVYGTNGGVGIKIAFPAPLKCGVPGSLFFGLLSQAAADIIEFKVDGNGLKFKAGKSNVSLATLPPDRMLWRFPTTETDAKPEATIKLSKDFLAGLARVLALKPAVTKRMEHYSICIFYVDKGELDLFATDSRSLLVMPVSEGVKGKAKRLALPREMAKHIIDHVPEGSELRCYSDHFAVKTDRLTLFSSVFDTSEMLDLPSYADKFADEKLAPPFDIPKELTAALDRVVLLAGSEEPRVDISVDGKKMSLLAEYRFGRVEEDFDLPIKVPKAKLTVNAKTLLGVDDKVKSMSVSSNAVNFQAEDGFMYVLAGVQPTQTRAEVEADRAAAHAPRRAAEPESELNDDIPI